MKTITSNPLLGVALHAVGAFFAATCYPPQKQVKRWSPFSAPRDEPQCELRKSGEKRFLINCFCPWGTNGVPWFYLRPSPKPPPGPTPAKSSLLPVTNKEKV